MKKNKITGFTVAEILLAIFLISIITVLMLPFINGSLKFSSWQKSMDYKMGALKYAKILGALEKNWSNNSVASVSSSLVSSAAFLQKKTNTILTILNTTGATPEWTDEQMDNMKNPRFTNTAVLADGTWIGEVASNNCSGKYSDTKNPLVENICSTLYVDTNGKNHKSIIGEDVLIMLFLKNGKVLAMSYKNGKLDLNTKLGKLYKAKRYTVKCPNSDEQITYVKDEYTGLYNSEGKCPTCTISTLDELKNSLSSPKCNSYSLISNITFSSTDSQPLTIKNGVNLNGNGKIISGFTITNTNSKNGVGVFANIGCDTKISNLTLDDINIETTSDNVGALAGKACGDINEITVQNSFVSGNNNVGGIVGYQASDVVANLKNIIIPRVYAQNIATNLTVKDSFIIGKSNIEYFIGNKTIDGTHENVQKSPDISCSATKTNKGITKNIFHIPTQALQNGACKLKDNEPLTQNNVKLICNSNGKLCHQIDNNGHKKTCKDLAPKVGDKINREETWDGSKYREQALYPPDAYLEGRCEWPEGYSYNMLSGHKWTEDTSKNIRIENGQLVFGAFNTNPYTCADWCKANAILIFGEKQCPNYCFVKK